MSTLRILSHTPLINQINVPRNPVIKVTFDRDLNKDSADYRVISVNDTDYVSVPGTINFEYVNSGTPSGIRSILTYTPAVLLTPQQKYNVFLYKTPDSILGEDGSFLTSDYMFSFTTGIELIDTNNVTYPTDDIDRLKLLLDNALSSGNYDDAASIIEDIRLIEAGGSLVPSGTLDVYVPPTSIGKLSIESTYPINGQSNVKLDKLKFIKLSFNDVPQLSGIDPSSYVEVSYKNVLE